MLSVVVAVRRLIDVMRTLEGQVALKLGDRIMSPYYFNGNIVHQPCYCFYSTIQQKAIRFGCEAVNGPIILCLQKQKIGLTLGLRLGERFSTNIMSPLIILCTILETL
ncbi:hypothetical protein CEXT_804851 [Caerostris extrusa]|uniref:Uncharacterized protein n=1 Tax=Caerostris extrusa TaxID=172846 RepID=A0AAV4VVB0_CAEEX|nr:hypothetical protein CEXT_804851 [Caerostris extrusa]